MIEILTQASQQYGVPVQFQGSPYELNGALVCDVANDKGEKLGQIALIQTPDWEGRILDEMGGKWKGKYAINWCHMCDTASISHNGCPGHGSSCNSGGCKECLDDFTEFNKLKTSVQDYITPEEAKVWEKCLRIRKHIVESLQRCEKEIVWAKLSKEGHLSQHEQEMLGLVEEEYKYRQGRISAPFTTDQAARLNQWQENPAVHPFTCGNEHKGSVSLCATENGWICPSCDYTQDWAHDFMLENPVNPLNIMKEEGSVLVEERRDEPSKALSEILKPE